jgi:hypothetical protein
MTQRSSSQLSPAQRAGTSSDAATRQSGTGSQPAASCAGTGAASGTARACRRGANGSCSSLQLISHEHARRLSAALDRHPLLYDVSRSADADIPVEVPD